MSNVSSKNCINCDWYSQAVEKCARPSSCKKDNEYFKCENSDKLFREGDFYYTFL
jgi:hypothetical protein